MRALIILAVVAACGKDNRASPNNVSTDLTGALDLKKAKPLTLSLKQLESAGSGSPLAFDLTPELNVVAVSTAIERRGPGDFSWTGTIANRGMAVITVSPRGVIGTIVAGNRTFRIVALNGILQAVPVRVQPKLPHPQLEKHGPPPTETKDYHGPVELIVAYTSAAATACSDTETSIETLIQNAVDTTNAVAAKSEANVSFDLAHKYPYPTTYSEASRSMQEIVDDFSNAPEVQQLRHAHHADIAVLFVHHNDGTYAGMSAETTAEYKTAFSVVECSQVLDYYAMTHEIGHLFGLNDDEDLPNMSTFTYGYGLAHDTNDGNGWRTVMSNGVSCKHDCPLIPYWSNPAVSYDGVATGVAGKSEDTRVIEQMKGIISQFE